MPKLVSCGLMFGVRILGACEESAEMLTLGVLPAREIAPSAARSAKPTAK